MEKIKRLSPWEIIDLWETDAGTMDFADTDLAMHTSQTAEKKVAERSA